MKTFYLFIFFLISSYFSFAQTEFIHEKRDYIWLTGYSSNPDIFWVGGTRIDFNYDPPLIEYEYRDMNFDITNASICDAEGELLFYTNGIAVAGADNQIIENGTGLNPDPYRADWVSRGYPLYQGALILLSPTDTQNIYSIFHGEYSWAGENPGGNVRQVYSFYETEVQYNDSIATVLEKNIPIIQDTLDFGKITATRHANGRDWWIILQKYFSNQYHRLLYDSNGLNYLGMHPVGMAVPSGLGQAVFSPDGKSFVSLTLHLIGEDQYLNIFDFDRCTGLLSNPRHIIYRDTAIAGGVAISQNSRFLYVSSFLKMYQYDLLADDIEASVDTLDVYDGFESPFGTPFFLAQLAPDDKIYINTNSTVDVLHVIHEPDKKGKACDFEQHGVQLPTLNAFTMPNNPYYGLGPLDDSPCDTLNINNPPPLADFVYQADSNFQVDFYDKSLYQAETWSWNFGDGNFSTERFPSHSYDLPAIYTVCLTVTSPIGSDTYCQDVNLEITSTDQVIVENSIFSIFPNPCQGDFAISTTSSFPKGSEIFIYNLLGQKELQQKVQDGQTRQIIDVSHLPKGAYIIQLVVDGLILATEKILKQ